MWLVFFFFFKGLRGGVCSIHRWFKGTVIKVSWGRVFTKGETQVWRSNGCRKFPLAFWLHPAYRYWFIESQFLPMYTTQARFDRDLRILYESFRSWWHGSKLCRVLRLATTYGPTVNMRLELIVLVSPNENYLSLNHQHPESVLEETFTE